MAIVSIVIVSMSGRKSTKMRAILDFIDSKIAKDDEISFRSC